MIVPDSIEPIVGWRSWQVAIHDGRPTLQACTRHVLWLPGERMEARCKGGPGPQLHHYWDLVPVDGSGSDSRIDADVSPGPDPGLLNVRTPRSVPPPGFMWELRVTTTQHTSPDENCRCGIYAARTIDYCMEGTVYGQINGWGKVVHADDGFRCQYAYPKTLYAPAALVPTLADNYPGTPVEKLPASLVTRARARGTTRKVPIPTTTWAPTPGSSTKSYHAQMSEHIQQLLQQAAQGQTQHKRFRRGL